MDLQKKMLFAQKKESEREREKTSAQFAAIDECWVRFTQITGSDVS